MTARTPSVLFVINSLAGGGAERVLATLLASIEPARADFRFSLALLDREPIAQSIPDWIEVHQLDCDHRTLSSIGQLRRLVREVRPDLINSHLTRSNVASAIAARDTGCPLVITEHVSTFAHTGRGIRAALTRAFVRRFYRWADRAIAVSSGVRNDLIENFSLDPGKIVVVLNPVDCDAVRRSSDLPNPFVDQRPYLMAIGRLMPSKNHAMLIKAFARSGYPGRLIIAGEGPERAALEQLGRDLEVGERILLPGYLPNPYCVLKDADAFVLSSSVEGFSLALVEALALDKPVISTDCPDGPSEILAGMPAGQVSAIQAVQDGILVPVNDADRLGEAISTLSLRESGKKRRQSSRIRPEFSPIVARDAYFDVFRRVLSDKQPLGRGGLGFDRAGRSNRNTGLGDREAA